MSQTPSTIADGLLDALIESVADRVIAAIDGRQTPTTQLAVETPNLAVSYAEAAELLSMSVDTFRRHALPDLRVVRAGGKRVVAIAELQNWLDRSAARALDGAPLAHGSGNPHGNRPSGGAQGDAPRVVSSPSRVAARPSWQDDDRRDEFS